MIREHLYRAKRIDNGEWVEGNLIQNTDFSYIATKEEYSEIGYCGECDRPFADLYKIDPNTVCEYTGLTDKNGTKIFEGDIIEAGYYKWKCKVVWDADCARYIGVTNDRDVKIVYISMVDKDDKSAVEVIGNMHDNLKLLMEDNEND